MKDLDAECLDVCDFVKARFFSLANDHGLVNNIIGLFFHDLVSHFTGILIHRAASRGYGKDIDFPWVNKGFTQKPFIYYQEPSEVQIRARSAKEIIKEIAVIPIAGGNAIPFGYKEKQFVRQTLNVLLSHPFSARAWLAGHAGQVQYLRDVVYELCQRVSITDSDTVWENWNRYALFHTSANRESITLKGLIVGTRNDLHNRKLAINFMSQHKPVIGFTHGEVSNSVYDEPVFGYSDKTLCTTLVDYGDFVTSKETHKAIIRPENFIRRSSKVVARRFRPVDKVKHRELHESRVLYVPTIYQANALYGPSHAYEAAIYHQWHMTVARVVPNMVLKLHPKNRFSPTNHCRVEERRLDECLGDYEVIMFDFLATGAVLSIFSDKPVIYFDIGLRNLNPAFARSLEQRCSIIPIDWGGVWEEQVRDGIEKYESEAREYSNRQLERFSICEHDQLRMRDVILDIIRQ